jgi:polyhydroxyalkanoate synthase
MHVPLTTSSEGSTPDPSDPYGFSDALGQLAAATQRHPAEMNQAAARYWATIGEISATASARFFGFGTTKQPEPSARDKRFADQAWEETPFFYSLRRTYEALNSYGEQVMAAGLPDLDPVTARKAEFAVRSMLDALSPTNYLFTNPQALRKAAETGGASVAEGFAHFLRDVAGNRGLPQQVNPSAFRVGVDLAITQGEVVYRNDLIELIQYAPQTDGVHEIPLLCSPPWINRYYVMDLAPGRSFIEWAVQHRHTVFTISYRNPDASMAGTSFEDYVESARASIGAIREITGAPRVNIAGLCLGGVLTMVLLSVLAAEGDESIGAATVMNTIADFSEPGVLGVFTDPASVEHLAQEMERQGYLDSATIADVFTLIRPNDLIWNYVASNWLMGEEPSDFDILAWNNDAVRLPAAMYTKYLRSLYVGNDLANGRFEVGDTRISLGAATNDLYILAAENDHITPWRSAYATTHLVSGSTTFVRSSAGHIAGIVNPPNPKAAYWLNPEFPDTPEEWLESATKHSGSWWEHWTTWIEARAGALVDPPRMGSDEHPPMEPSPGQYIFS